jgi:transmembrane sensor
MRPEEVSKIRRELEPPWNDLREQRVLGRIQEARRRARRRPAHVLAGGAAVLAAAAVVLVAIRWSGRSRVAPGESPSTAASAIAPPSPGHEQRLALADGSQALLVRDARVRVEEQRPDLVHIAQETGEVRYEVRPDRAREFVVVAPGATVRVRGTIFDVDVGVDHVEVRVERGKVEVDDAARRRELVAGESLRLPTRDVARADDSASAVVESPQAAVEPAPAAAPSSHPSFADLMTKADEARAAGRQDEAARALERLLAAYPQDPRAPNALFILGKVERARGDPQASGRAFERCLRAAPSGPLAQDALAESASSWAAAGNADAAKRFARRYLDRWPGGIQATQMRAILER